MDETKKAQEELARLETLYEDLDASLEALTSHAEFEFFAGIRDRFPKLGGLHDHITSAKDEVLNEIIRLRERIHRGRD